MRYSIPESTKNTEMRWRVGVCLGHHKVSVSSRTFFRLFDVSNAWVSFWCWCTKWIYVLLTYLRYSFTAFA